MIHRIVSHFRGSQKSPDTITEPRILEQTHDPIIRDLRDEAARLRARRRFPIASTVSYHRYRLHQGVDKHD